MKRHSGTQQGRQRTKCKVFTNVAVVRQYYRSRYYRSRCYTSTGMGMADLSMARLMWTALLHYLSDATAGGLPVGGKS